ncbi:MAG: cysteine synthase A [Clostridia bacterium]|nr:cysteine synthase A [Clostridia bacterium]
MKIFENLSELIGNTPLLKLNRFAKEYGLKANIYAKLEYFNPAGSIKDRVAFEMIDAAEKDGTLKEGSVIIEPTSGNTGIGLAAIAAAKGYKAIIIMPETMSEERKKLMKAYGAELILTDGAKGMAGCIEKAEELKATLPNSIIAGQFVNPANPTAHIKTTAPEIWSSLDGKVDAFVAGIGTGGTITGNGRYLKEKNPDIKIFGVEPASSPLITEGKAGAHKIQGIGANFVPEILDLDVVDEVMPIADEDSYKYAQAVVKTEGVFVGISSGAALCAAVELAKKDSFKGKNIVVVFPDGGDRYLSTPDFI